MGRAQPRTVLFLCTGNYYRSRFAEYVFNATAVKFGLPWRALSRGLALERGVKNIGPMARSAVQLLQSMGIRGPDQDRLPLPVLPEDLASATRIIALHEDEHRPLMAERHPDWLDRIEYWHAEDVDGILPQIERDVHGLIARLLGGTPDQVESPVEAPVVAVPERRRAKPVVCLGRETKGRRGKGVTTVSEVPLDEAGIRDLAARLKERCGTGGTVRDGVIEIQGDQRDRVAAELEAMGYRVKRVGG